MKIIKVFFVFVLVIFISETTCFSVVKIEDDTQEWRSIEKSSFVFIDTENVLAINDVKDGHVVFSKFENSHAIIKSDVTVWMRFEIENKRAYGLEWVVNFYDPDYTLIELYDNDKISTYGTQFPFTKKRFFHKNYIFPIHLNPSEKKTVYVKMQSATGATIKADLTSIEKHQAYALSEYYTLGIYYGILFILCVYNFILFFHTKYNTYLFYVFYLLCSILFSFNEDGLGFQFFWNQFPWFNRLVDFFAPLLLLISFLGFASSFLEIKRNGLKFKVLLASAVLVLVSHVLQFGGLIPEKVSFFFYLIPFIVLFYIARVKQKEKYSDSIYFLVGNTLIFSSMVVYFLRLNNWVYSGIFEVYVFNFSVIIEAVVLSIAVANKIKRGIKNQEETQEQLIHSLKEKELLTTKVNRELELKVSERTTQLVSQKKELRRNNDELISLQERLFKMNEALDLANFKLKKEVKSYSRERILNKEVSYEVFMELYGNAKLCRNYLYSLKEEQGFTCKKCDSNKFVLKKDDARQCISCKHLESVTANTIFHALKFPLPKAFYLVYITNYDRNKFTLDQLSDLLDLGRNTCWSFTKKVNDKKEQLLKQGEGQISFDELIYR